MEEVTLFFNLYKTSNLEFDGLNNIFLYANTDTDKKRKKTKPVLHFGNRNFITKISFLSEEILQFPGHFEKFWPSR